MRASETIVDTPFGKVRGEAVGGTIHFRRIPYADPPTAGGRFAKPSAPPHWAGGYDATRQGPIPPQTRSRLADVMGDYDAPQDENCLHVDIWTPRDAKGAPVLVFIHGGGFLTGGGSLPCYDGGALSARTGLVVVNISYRLGALGFLYVPGVSTPNLAIHDQIAALRWIRQAIASFGGDPARVTAAGQSGGAYTIAVMGGLESGPELFDRAILMSTPLGVRPQTFEDAERTVADVLKALDMSPSQTDSLRDLPVDRFLHAQEALLRRPPARPGEITPPFMPLVDNDLIKADPRNAPNSSPLAWCDAIVGVTREEFAAFSFNNPMLQNLPEPAIQKIFEARYGEQANARLKAAKAMRVPNTPLELLGDMMTADSINGPSLALAASHHGQGHQAYFYQFDWQSPEPGLHACHCIDLPFLFGNLETWSVAPMLAGSNKAEITDLSNLFQDAIAAFVASGNPNGSGLPKWPPYAKDRAIMHFDRRVLAMSEAI